MAERNIKLDEEWVQLILEAKMQGLTKEEIISYLRRNQVSAISS